MADYKELYLMLLKANEEAMEVLNKAQNMCEEQYAELAEKKRTRNKF